MLLCENFEELLLKYINENMKSFDDPDKEPKLFEMKEVKKKFSSKRTVIFIGDDDKYVIKVHKPRKIFLNKEYLYYEKMFPFYKSKLENFFVKSFSMMGYDILIMPFLGVDLIESSFSDVKEIGIQMLDFLEELNKQNIIHSDIKPDNICISQEKVILIDYEFALNMTQYEISNTIRGTYRYLSIPKHQGKEDSYVDDLISLVYSLFYIYDSDICPWMKDTDYNVIYRKKLQFNGDNLPQNLYLLYQYAILLKRDEEINYKYCRDILNIL